MVHNDRKYTDFLINADSECKSVQQAILQLRWRSIGWGGDLDNKNRLDEVPNIL